MNKPTLYWLTNHDYNHEKEVLVDKISEGKYRVLEFGKFKPILCSGCLVDNSIAVVLSKYVPDQIGKVNKVTIWRKATDQTWTNYSEIEIKNALDLENFNTAEHDGFRIYLLMYNDIYIFFGIKGKATLRMRKSK